MKRAQAPGAPAPKLLAELPEAEASGEIRHIYNEIRRLSCVPMVALIWRHLATLPGTLEWAWGLLEPAMRAGAVQEVAARLAATARIARPHAIPAAALRAAGLDEDDQRAIGEVLEGYNRANPVNIVMLRCVSTHLGGGIKPAGAQDWPQWQAPPAPPALPPMINPGEMSPMVHALALLLTDRGNTASPSTLWPSLYRHLAHWPAFLGYAGVIVPPEFEAIDAVAARLRAQVDEAVALLAPRLAPAAAWPTPTGAQAAALQSAIGQFTGRIPEMVVIGNLLQDALPAAPH